MVVIITGASGGLGQTVTKAFVDSGASVVAVSSNWRSMPPGVLAVSADLSTDAGCASVVQAALDGFGQIDALVHLVGGFAAGTAVEDTAADGWTKMMDLNFWPAVRMLRVVLPGMKARGSGRVAMIGSKGAADAAAGMAAYNASKSALMALVRTAAAECKGSGVTVNAVLPSVIDTPAGRGAASEGEIAKWVAPESIASLLVWLCSDAGRDVTGALIPVYGRV